MNEGELSKIFKVFGNQRRIKILKLLKSNKELSVGEIARLIRLSVKSTSKHLSILLNIGLLENEGKKKSVYYRLNSKLKGFLSLTLRNIP